MTALAGGSAYPIVKFTQVGQVIEGTILGSADVQANKFQTTEPDFWPNGDPKMQVRVTLEMGTDYSHTDKRSTVTVAKGEKATFYIAPGPMTKDARVGLAEAGLNDIDDMTYMKAMRTGGEGRSGSPWEHRFEFTPYEPPVA